MRRSERPSEDLPWRLAAVDGGLSGGEPSLRSVAWRSSSSPVSQRTTASAIASRRCGSSSRLSEANTRSAGVLKKRLLALHG